MKALIDGDLCMNGYACWLDGNGYVKWKNDEYVHRFLAEKALGRKLKSSEIVHHIDGNKQNNSNENLLVCSQAYHLLIHMRQRIYDDGYDPNKYHYCSGHKQYHLKEEFSTSNSHSHGLHNTCRKYTNEYRKQKGLNMNKFNWRERLNQQYRRAFKNNNVEVTQL